MKRTIVLLLLFFLIENIKAQKLENIDVQIVNGNIVLAFDLLPVESVKEQYDIEITSSKDNYRTPVKVLNGSTKNVEPKGKLKYTIDGFANFEGYSGPLDFQINANLVYSPLRFLSPSTATSVKKGKSMNLVWRGGAKNARYNLGLYKSGVKISTIKSGFSNKTAIWQVPSDSKPGSDYTMKVEVENNMEQSAFTKEFKIKRKIPIVVKVLPLVIAGGVFAVISGGGSSEPGTTTSDDLPGPPDTPN